MALEDSDLARACLECARRSMESRTPVDVARIEELAERFLSMARDYQDDLTRRGGDENLALNCVRYLTLVHSMPPNGDSTSWFLYGMMHLTELVCPNSQGLRENELFYKDVIDGIEYSRDSYPRQGLIEVPIDSLLSESAEASRVWPRCYECGGVAEIVCASPHWEHGGLRGKGEPAIFCCRDHTDPTAGWYWFWIINPDQRDDDAETLWNRDFMTHIARKTWGAPFLKWLLSTYELSEWSEQEARKKTAT